MTHKSFGSYIRSLRIQNHMTQAELADHLNVTDKAVSKWERNLSYPDISLFPKLADLLGVTIDDLLKEDSREEQPSRLAQIFEMSNDIRAPLHLILGCADMAKMYRNDPEAVARYLECIHVSGGYLLDLIDQVIQTTKQNQGLKSDWKMTSGVSDKYDFSGKRILIAEDNDLHREVASELLTQTGAEIEFAENGLICVEKVSAAPAGYYDLILMDIMMPVMDGMEATMKIRQMDDVKKSLIPIIALSANEYDKDRIAALLSGMNDFSDKPIFVEQLFSTMKKYL